MRVLPQGAHARWLTAAVTMAAAYIRREHPV